MTKVLGIEERYVPLMKVQTIVFGYKPKIAICIKVFWYSAKNVEVNNFGYILLTDGTYIFSISF